MAEKKNLILCNEKTKNTYRAVIANQGKWIYYLTQEGVAMGLTAQFAKDAMYELGTVYGNNQFSSCSTLNAFSECLMNRAMEEGRHATAVINNGVLTVQISFNPMYELWGELTNQKEEKMLLHEVACEFYRGLAEQKGFSFSATAPDDVRFGACVLMFHEA